MAMSEDQYKKVSDFLLEQGQQELNGHLDGLWQELNDLRKNAPDNQDSRENVQAFQDKASAGETKDGGPSGVKTGKEGSDEASS